MRLAVGPSWAVAGLVVFVASGSTTSRPPWRCRAAGAYAYGLDSVVVARRSGVGARDRAAQAIASVLRLIALPFGLVTVTAPDRAARGTVSVIFVGDSTLNFAGTPFTVTDVAPARLTPITVTFAPGFARNGLTALIANELQHDPYSSHLFVFRGKRGDYLKMRNCSTHPYAANALI